MRKRNRSAKVAQLRARLTPIDLLVFLLAGLLVLAMAGLSGASEWDETLAKAKEEGKFVAVLGGGASRQLRPIFRIFEKKFGIRTVVSTGGGRRQADRILAERGAKKYKADIFMVGTTSGVSRIVRNDAADPIPPVLFLPEVVDKSLWYKGQHFYSDPQQKYLFAFSGRVDRSPIEMRFNTNKLSIEEAKKIDSMWTFLDKRFAGNIVAIPPGPGAGATYFNAMFHPDLGEKYLRRFFSPELNVKFSSDYRLISDGVAKGKYTMAVFAGSAGRDIDRLSKNRGGRRGHGGPRKRARQRRDPATAGTQHPDAPHRRARGHRGLRALPRLPCRLLGDGQDLRGRWRRRVAGVPDSGAGALDRTFRAPEL